MSTVSDAARAAAAARRAAELAAKKAAEAAAKKAAGEAARKNTQKSALNKASLVKTAGNKPTASGVRQSLGKDELSQGLGRSLRARMGDGLGTPPPSAPTAGRTMSLSELRAVQAKGGPIAPQRSQAALRG